MNKVVNIFILLCWQVEKYNFSALQFGTDLRWTSTHKLDLPDLSSLSPVQLHHTLKAESVTDYTVCILCVIKPWKQNLSLTTLSVFCVSSHPVSKICHWSHSLYSVLHHTKEAESLTDYTVCILCVITPCKQNLSLITQSVFCASSHQGSRISHWLHCLYSVCHHTL